jgi:hypothetical protein
VKDTISLIATLWLGSMFASTALLKLVDIRGARSSIRRLGLLPDQLAAVVGVALPVAEAACAALLFSRGLNWLGGALASVVGVTFAGGAALILRRGALVDCGCAGRDSHRPVDVVTVARGLAIAVAGGAVAVIGAQGPPTWLSAALSASVVACVGCWETPRLIASIRRNRAKASAHLARDNEIAALARLLESPSPGRLDVGLPTASQVSSST